MHLATPQTAFYRPRLARCPRAWAASLLIGSVLASGCTTLREYVSNGFKVGPNYGTPPAAVAKEWIDAADKRVRTEEDDQNLNKWWAVFNDPVLDSLICSAYQQNLTLRVAGYRILEARAQYAIDVGNLFPQTQAATGDFTRNGQSVSTATRSSLLVSGAKRWYSQWDGGFNLSWELDFWGRFRRAVESDAAILDASVENYDDVLVTLLGDVATNYVNYRTFEQRIEFAKENVELQRKTLTIVDGQFKQGLITEVNPDQTRSLLEQTEATIPELEISLRQAANQLCILLGIPPEDLSQRLKAAPIPTAPPQVVLGIPADLLRRRPDVRRAERQAAAQCAQIGVAEADFYPHISINGNITYSADHFKDLFKEDSFSGTVGPSFQWNILNYGRILNGVRLQDARFQELVATYQNTVLSANQDVENGLVTFLRAQERTKLQAASVADAEKVVKIRLDQQTFGAIDVTPLILAQQNLVQQQDTLAQAQGEIALGLIQAYRAMGGGWQIRLTGCKPDAVSPANTGDARRGEMELPSGNKTDVVLPAKAEQPGETPVIVPVKSPYGGRGVP